MAALGGFPPHCGLAVMWVSGASLRNLLFLMASRVPQCQELDLIFFFHSVVKCHGLTEGVLPLPGQWVLWGLCIATALRLWCLAEDGV